jgi:hypothetical protein
MNYAKGGPRILMVCVTLIWLICGGVTTLFVFGDAPASMPYTESTWRGLGIGTGVAALLAAHAFLNLMKELVKDQANSSGGVEFLASLWGMVATFIGWIAGLGCVMATVGGWEPPLKFMYSSGFSAGIVALAMIAVIWLIPIGLFLFFAWIWEGFASEG